MASLDRSQLVHDLMPIWALQLTLELEGPEETDEKLPYLAMSIKLHMFFVS